MKEQTKLTKLQWWSKGFDINPDAKGEWGWNNGWCTFEVVRYSEEEVHPDENAKRKWRNHRNEIAKKSREKIACEKAKRAAEEAWEEEFSRDYYTAWQMLSQTKRVPLDGYDCVIKEWNILTPCDEWIKASYYYYDIKKSRKTSDEEYQQLKKLYIDKFGGWDTIDLDNTTYNGRVWW